MLDRGRPPKYLDHGKKRSLMDSVLATWPKDQEVLHFMDIHRALIEKGIVEDLGDRYKTNRILGWLIEAGLMEKKGRGQYRITVKPDEFKLFDYLGELREKYRKKDLIYKGRVGGYLWTSNENYYLGMPSNLEEEKDAYLLMQILETRLARIFQGYQQLAYHLKVRRETGVKSTLPGAFLEEVLLELIPWWTGCKMGPDGNGLYITDLKNLIKGSIDNLPESVKSDGWENPIEKKLLKEHFDVIAELIDRKQKEISDYYNDKKNSGYDEAEESLSLAKSEINQLVMIIAEPEFHLDEKGFDKRLIYDILTSSVKEKEDDLTLVQYLLPYDMDLVNEALKRYGRSVLGYERFRKVIKIYESMKVSDNISYWFGPFYEPKRGASDDSLKGIAQLLEKYKAKDLIYYLAFSRGSISFINETPEKFELICQLFSNISRENVKKWYLEGLTDAKALHKKIFDKFISEK